MNPWPPPGWPNCPSRERLEAALEYIEDDQENFQAMVELAVREFLEGRRMTILTCRKAPARIRDDVETVLAELAARSAALLIDHEEPEEPGLPAQHPLQFFLRAARLSTHASIGTVLVKFRGEDEMPSIAYGVTHRAQDWTGLCPVLREAAGLEGLIFCDATHEPDVVMMMPRDLLDCDPGSLRGCGQGAELAAIPVNRTLAGVLRHHGCNPHLVDICRRSGMEESLGRLFLQAPEEERRNGG